MANSAVCINNSVAVRIVYANTISVRVFLASRSVQTAYPSISSCPCTSQFLSKWVRTTLFPFAIGWSEEASSYSSSVFGGRATDGTALGFALLDGKRQPLSIKRKHQISYWTSLDAVVVILSSILNQDHTKTLQVQSSSSIAGNDFASIKWPSKVELLQEEMYSYALSNKMDWVLALSSPLGNYTR